MKHILTLFFFTFFLSAQAQQSVNVSGGNASGSNGNASYSVGQVVYATATGTNGSANQGVQQPFDISTLGTDDFPNISLAMSVYPNPTSASVSLKIDNFDLEHVSYVLADVQGKLISNGKITQTETPISLENTASGVYFLLISNNAKAMKTFKIIKQ